MFHRWFKVTCLLFKLAGILTFYLHDVSCYRFYRTVLRWILLCLLCLDFILLFLCVPWCVMSGLQSVNLLLNEYDDDDDDDNGVTASTTVVRWDRNPSTVTLMIFEWWKWRIQITTDKHTYVCPHKMRKDLWLSSSLPYHIRFPALLVLLYAHCSGKIAKMTETKT